MIKYLEIENFKGIQKLKIENFSSINIFVGEPNIGKTTILEALSFLYETPKNHPIYDSFGLRGYEAFDYDETYPSYIRRMRISNESLLNTYENLFYDMDMDNKINILSNFRNLQIIPKTAKARNFFPEKQEIDTNYTPETIGETTKLISSNHKIKTLNNVYNEITNDNNKKKLFIRYLKDFDKNIYDCELKNNDLHIRTDTLTKAINIKQMGQGFIFYATICALLVRGDKTIIIDEIENGFHYSAMSLVMKIIFDKAKNENIQFFLSTHNLEFLSKASFMLESGKFGDNLVNVFSLFRRKDNSIDYIHYDQQNFINQIDLENEIRSL